MKRIIENMFYREGDDGAQGGGTGIPPAPAVTEAPTGAESATGIPASLPVTEGEDVVPGEGDGDGAGEYKFSVNDENTRTLDDIPFHTEDDEQEGGGEEASASEEPEAEPAEPAAVTEEVDAKPAVEVVPEAVIKALQNVAGSTETDPAKLLEVIETRKAELATDQQKQREAAELAFEQKAIEGLQQQATNDVVALINPAVKARLATEEYDVDNAPAGWWDVNSPNYDEAMTLRYNQVFNELRVQPQYEKAYVNAFNEHKSAYDADKAKIAEFATKYPNHATELVSDLRQAGATVGFMERIAHVTDQAVTKAIATSHTAMAAKDAELATLKAQIAGHADAVAKAKAEGVTEGRKAALVLAKGQAVPSTVGVGAIAPAPYKYDPNRRLTLDDIPDAKRNSF